MYGGGAPKEVLVEHAGQWDIQREKVQSLQSRVWLNDEVINFYYFLMQVRGPRMRVCTPQRGAGLGDRHGIRQGWRKAAAGGAH